MLFKRGASPWPSWSRVAFKKGRGHSKKYTADQNTDSSGSRALAAKILSGPHEMTWPAGARRLRWVATRHCPGASCSWMPSWARNWWSGCLSVPGTPCSAAARCPCSRRLDCCTGGRPCCWDGRSLTPTRCPGWRVSGVSSAARSRTSRVCTPAVCTKTTCSKMWSRWRRTVSSRGKRSWEPPDRTSSMTSGRLKTKWGRGWRMSLRYVYLF